MNDIICEKYDLNINVIQKKDCIRKSELNFSTMVSALCSSSSPQKRKTTTADFSVFKKESNRKRCNGFEGKEK